jgi:Cys-tRNA(Pro)/Cys-tRNA(Cys) deacylase
MAQAKTNVQRILEQKKIPYTPHTYDAADGKIDGVSVAAKTGLDPRQVYKTLVTRGASKSCYVFLVPVERELDLKAAARAVGEKSIAMIAQKELLPLTGYIHGGCSPIGMKKQFPTVIDVSAREQAAIAVSAGHIGAQVELSPVALADLIHATFHEITL